MSSGNQVDRTTDDAGTTMTKLITAARWPAPAPKWIDTALETLHRIEPAAMFGTIPSSPADALMQSTCIPARNEPAHDITQEQIEAPRVKAPPPEFDQCCYPIGEPRTPRFSYCYAPVAQPGAVYCTEHKRLCHLRQD